MNGKFPEPGTEQPETPNLSEPAYIEPPGRFTARRRVRWFAWAASVAAFVAFVVVGRVHTRLGVEAPTWDKNGREYVWRVWWRARHDIVSFGPDGAVTFVYVAIAIAFIALCFIAVWLALVPEDRELGTSDTLASESVAPR